MIYASYFSKKPMKYIPLMTLGHWSKWLIDKIAVFFVMGMIKRKDQITLYLVDFMLPTY